MFVGLVGLVGVAGFRVEGLDLAYPSPPIGLFLLLVR